MVMTTLPALYAHRLGRDAGPDGSRAALTATLATPVDGVECDVCLTADGRLALLHDPWLAAARTTVSGWAHQTPWAAAARRAPARSAGRAHERDADAARGAARRTSGPTSSCRSRSRPTATPPSRARRAVAVCRGRGEPAADRERVEVLSFHVAACEEAARQGLAARLVDVGGLRARTRSRAGQRPAGVGGVCIEHFLLHPDLVDRLRARGLSVSTGTINDPVLATRAACLGVDAITSDRPAALRGELAAAQVLAAA